MSIRFRLPALVVLVALLFVSPAVLADGYHDIGAKFFDLVKQEKPGEAVDYVFGTNPWLGKVPDQIANVRTQFTGIETLVGQYVDYEILIDKKVTDRYAYTKYFVAYERQPIKIEVHYYRPKDEWMVLNFEFSTNFATELATME